LAAAVLGAVNRRRVAEVLVEGHHRRLPIPPPSLQLGQITSGLGLLIPVELAVLCLPGCDDPGAFASWAGAAMANNETSVKAVQIQVGRENQKVCKESILRSLAYWIVGVSMLKVLLGSELSAESVFVSS